MSYADLYFYQNEFGGNVVPSDLLENALKSASRAIDNATMYKIQDIEGLPEFAKRQVKLATCVQAEYIDQYGEINDFLSNVGGYSIGDVSVSSPQGSASVLGSHYGLCEKAIELLLPTGLLDRRLA